MFWDSFFVRHIGDQTSCEETSLRWKEQKARWSHSPGGSLGSPVEREQRKKSGSSAADSMGLFESHVV